jgi:hypothetical protein
LVGLTRLALGIDAFLIIIEDALFLSLGFLFRIIFSWQFIRLFTDLLLIAGRQQNVYFK